MNLYKHCLELDNYIHNFVKNDKWLQHRQFKYNSR